MRILRLVAHPAGIWIGFVACLMFLFWPGLVHSQIPAFRDAFHFYYPQAVWLDQCAARGEYFPQWNRFEGLGTSVPGQVSSALYYPLRVLWFLPGLSVAQRYSAVALAHMLLACVGMRLAARSLALPPHAANLTGIAFALSCPVFFQQHNLIYLCSATWIGFALAALFRYARVSRHQHPATRRSMWSAVRSAVGFGLATSLMLLAGDPHTAVNCFIVAALGWLGFAILERRWPSWGWFLGWLPLAGLTLVLVTAVQWLPAMRWSRHSLRMEMMAVTDTASETLATEAQHPEEHVAVMEFVDGIHPGQRPQFEFSLSPWHLGTILWPTLGGHFLPDNSRLFSALPAEGRMWVPSLYCGAIPALLVLACLHSRQSAGPWQRYQAWLLALVAFALLTSLGNYSPVWLAREFANATGWESLRMGLPADSSISLYGLLNRLVPGYTTFRYPAKWTVWFSAGFSLLAGLGLANAQARRERSWLPRRSWRLLLLLSVSLLLAAVWLFANESPWLQELLPFDPLLGQASVPAIAVALALGAGIALLSLILLSMLPPRPEWILGFTLLEMTLVATQWTCFVAPPFSPYFASGRAERTRPALPPQGSLVWSNLAAADLRLMDLPNSTTLAERQQRLQETFLMGKLAQAVQVRNFASIQSIESSLDGRLRLWLTVVDRLHEAQPEVDRTLAALGVTHRLVLAQDGEFRWQPVQAPQPLCEWVATDPTQSTDNLQWKWLAADHLQISGTAPAATRLLIRQYNDGGWRASCRQQVDGPPHLLPIVRAPTPFVVTEVPKGKVTVDVTRAPGW